MEDGVRSVMSGGDGGVVWWSGGWSKIMKVKEKRLSEDRSPVNHTYSLYTTGLG